MEDRVISLSKRYEYVELYLHSPMRLRGVYRDNRAILHVRVLL